ncbi:hypothetical protein GIB67_000845 [Kingdonia uniflora]|uniref:Uncharacterized protein n=1 Tax=Kingdonia uniflora TaxID=39325 RepID=A0A7J7NRI2_9MAGN|nr:hypothetical protein GIB67_000845 [Kingdonia uniflora]
MENPVAKLLDSRNLVLTNGMELGWDLKTGLNRYLSAWNNYDDPSIGYLTYEIVHIHGYPEVAMRKGLTELYQSRQWDGLRYSGVSHTTYRYITFITVLISINNKYQCFIHKVEDDLNEGTDVAMYIPPDDVGKEEALSLGPKHHLILI